MLPRTDLQVNSPKFTKRARERTCAHAAEGYHRLSRQQYAGAHQVDVNSARVPSQRRATALILLLLLLPEKPLFDLGEDLV
jgi:hypothetical protein